MLKPEKLRVNARYKSKTGNTFILFREFEPNHECFSRMNGTLHFGREFIEYRDGKTMIDLEEAQS